MHCKKERKNDNQYVRKVHETFFSLTLQTVCICQSVHKVKQYLTRMHHSKVLNMILSFNSEYLRENGKVHTNYVSTAFIFALVFSVLNHFDFLKNNIPIEILSMHIVLLRPLIIIF